MAFHRCNTSFLIGQQDDDGNDLEDLSFQQGRAYDDGDPRYKAAISRFPDHFDAPHAAAAK